MKSMAAESLHSSTVSWHGMAGDRRWAFIRPGMEREWFSLADNSRETGPMALRAVLH